VSFSLGKVFGEDEIESSWQWFIVVPGVFALLRLVLAFFTCNHDSPMQYSLFAKDAKTEEKREAYL